MALDTRCGGIYLAQIANNIVNWEYLAPYFELTEAETVEIRNNHPRQYMLQKRAMLWKWVERNGNKATYRAMKNKFESANNNLLADKVVEMFHDCDPAQPPALDYTTVANTFKQYLKDCYTIVDGSAVNHPGTANTKEMGPPLSDQAPFVDPELYLVLGTKKEQKKIVINDLFKEKEAQKILLEGIAGTGKTTLTRHICQRWAEGTLFRHVNLLVHLTLDHPFLWDAESLERMIPHPSAEFRKAVADEIENQQGKGCCFILDGWEDLPKGSKLSSFIHRCLKGTYEALSHCSFVVTSRPIASDTLQPLVTTTVEITKLSPESIHSYATQYLTQHGKDPTVFITELNNNPQARGLCSLPMNAAIMLHLFLFLATGLPTTQTELFKSFILNLLLRHLTKKKERYPGHLVDFSFLSASEAKSFKQLCSIAHEYSFRGSVIFSAQSNRLLTLEELKQAGLHDPCAQNTLGLMKVHQRLTWCGYTRHYGFLHSSVQDFLCALRMSQLGPDQQVRDFQHLIHNHPTSLILSFYAGLTQLNNEGVCSVLKQIGKNPPQDTAITALVRENIDYRRLFLTYLHCLYEANKRIFVEPDLKLHQLPFASICFNYLKLSAHDVNVIWYYMLDFVQMFYRKTELIFVFQNCHIGDLGIESASTILLNKQEGYGSSITLMPFGIDLTENNISHRGVSALSRLYSRLSLCLLILTGNNNDPSSSSGFIFLKSLIEQLSSPNDLKIRYAHFLYLAGCNFTSRHGYHLFLLMPFLEVLIASYNKLQGCVPFLVSATTNTKQLDLAGTEIKDEELIEIGHILQSNTSLQLQRLLISSTTSVSLSDSISPNTVCEFVELITAPNSRSTLNSLIIAHGYMQAIAQERIQAALQRFALTRGYQMKIRPLYTQENLISVLVSTDQAKSLPKTVLFGK